MNAVQAVAYGFIYFDDGVTLKQDQAKFEIYMIKDAAGTFTITVNNVGKKIVGDGKIHENIGNINILWASKSGVSTITKATLTPNTGGLTVISTTIDPKTETLTIPVTNVSFWNIKTIVLSVA